MKIYFGVPSTRIALIEGTQSDAVSPMIVTGGEISAGTNAGTTKIGAITALLREADSLTGALIKVTKAEEDNITIPLADTVYWISLNYNDGTPTISLVTSEPYDTDKRNIPIGRVMKDASGNIHWLQGGFRFQDGVKKLHQRAYILRKIELCSGSKIAYKDLNNFTMTEGIAYAGISEIIINAYDSSVTPFTPIRSNGAVFIEDADVNTIDFAHFDAQDGTLGNIGVAKYGVFWIYKHSDDQHVYVRYGTDSYTLAEAEVSKEPTKPEHLVSFGGLIGRIIVPQAGGSFAKIDMVTDRFFVGTEVADHSQLSNLDYAGSGHTGFASSVELTAVDEKIIVIQKTLVTGDTLWTNIIPAGYLLEVMAFEETAGNEAILSLGSTDGGNDIFTGQTIEASGITTITINKYFSSSAAQSLDLNADQSGDTWNSSSMTVTLVMRRMS